MLFVSAQSRSAKSDVGATRDTGDTGEAGETAAEQTTLRLFCNKVAASCTLARNRENRAPRALQSRRT